jgi:type I restriction enzyme S subunit
MSKYQPYFNYKCSGVDWLGDIPEHWEVKRLKNVSVITRGAILRPVNDPSYFDEDGEWLYLNISDVSKCDKFLYTAELKLSYIGSTKSARVLPNNLILTASATIGIPIINKVKVCIHDGFIAFKKIRINLIFMYYILLNKTIYSAMGKTNTQKNIYLDEVKIVKIGIPPLNEQKAIAGFLDYKTKQIDELIKKKETLLERLEEKRTALISHAVTKGLNPNVPMKDSGIEWLGDIPESWTISKAKFISRIFVPQRNKPDLNIDDGVPWLTMEDMLSDKIYTTSFKVTKESFEKAGSKILNKGSVIASCVGNFGICTINEIDVIINQQLQAFIPKKNIMAEYLRELVKISKDYFQMVATAATVVYVNQAGFANMPIILPPLNEQQKIINSLEKIKKLIDQQKAKIKEAIELLKEYRNALITNAVTGKIDVRQVTIPNPN